jgi:hypothetical protein
MLDVFKARLKAVTKAAGVNNLSQKRIDAFADRLHKKNPDVTELADHDKLINELDELVSFKDIAKEDDKIRTLEARKKSEEAQDDDDQDDDQDQEPPATKKKPAKKKDDEMPAWAKPLFEKVTALETEKRTGTIKSKLAEKLKDKGIPEKFYSKRALPEKEEDLEDFASEIETDWTELKQDSNNAGLASSSIPAGGTSGVKKGQEDAIIDRWAKSKEPETTKK